METTQKMTEYSREQREESSWYVKRCTKEKLIVTRCECNIKTVVEKHISSENIYSDIVADDEVPSYTYHHSLLNKLSNKLKLFSM